MTVQVRDGLVCETICGTTLIIATLETRAECPYITKLNDASAYIWKKIQEKRSLEEIAALASEDYHISVADAQNAVQSFVKSMLDKKLLQIIE